MPASAFEIASLVEELRLLDNRRLHDGPPLTPDELTRWGELRAHVERATAAVRPLGVERRLALRVRTHLDVDVSWDAARELVRTNDLSEGGVSLQTSHPCAPGTEVRLELRDSRGRPLYLEGTVVWARVQPDPAGPPSMGIRFRNLTDWDRALLAELMELALRSL